jgi:predicted kinase
MPGSLILVAGYAGSGKTHVGQDIARRLPACYLDKDTLTSPLVERLLLALNQPAGDRDSSLYRQEIRPLEYEALIAAGLEAASLGAAVVLSAPFLAQLTNPAWTSWLSAQTSDCGVHLQAVWIACDRSTLRQRMSQRNSPRDRSKLLNWTSYSATLEEHLDQQFHIPTRRFVNSEPTNYDNELAKLLDALRQD